MSEKPIALRLADCLEGNATTPWTREEAAAELRRLHTQRDELLEALRLAEAALSDIGDADREPGDDLAWCEARAAQDLPAIRAAIVKAEGSTT